MYTKLNPPRIFRAVKYNMLSQGFGIENTAKNLILKYNNLGLKGHDGWDFAITCKNQYAKHGGQCENIYCDIDGYATITYISKDESAGWGIMAQDQDPNFKHCWWHFDSINPDLKVGSRIEGGMCLGVGGNTGMSTGGHLHRALYSYNAGDNGYKSAIDMTPYFTNIYILDKINTMNQTIGIIEKFKNLIPNWQDIIDKIKKGFNR